jgi:hypothetical protein
MMLFPAITNVPFPYVMLRRFVSRILYSCKPLQFAWDIESVVHSLIFAFYSVIRSMNQSLTISFYQIGKHIWITIGSGIKIHTSSTCNNKAPVRSEINRTSFTEIFFVEGPFPYNMAFGVSLHQRHSASARTGNYKSIILRLFDGVS